MAAKDKVNFAELISAVRVAELANEEEALSRADMEVNQIKAESHDLILRMEGEAAAGREGKRRELRNELVILNLRLVTRVLQKYGHWSPDKFQNGCIGLLQAAETFNREKGVPFASYACFCIETEIRLAYKKQTRAFESKVKGFLDSLDAPISDKDGGQMDKHDLAMDPFAEQELDSIIEEVGTEELFYDIIIPCIDRVKSQAADFDIARWKELEIRYFMELSMESSQQQRLTMSQIARELGTVTQNMLARHKRLMKDIRKECQLRGYDVAVSSTGRARVVRNEEEREAFFNKGKRK